MLKHEMLVKALLFEGRLDTQVKGVKRINLKFLIVVRCGKLILVGGVHNAKSTKFLDFDFVPRGSSCITPYYYLNYEVSTIIFL